MVFDAKKLVESKVTEQDDDELGYYGIDGEVSLGTYEKADADKMVKELNDFCAAMDKKYGDKMGLSGTEWNFKVTYHKADL